MENGEDFEFQERLGERERRRAENRSIGRKVEALPGILPNEAGTHDINTGRPITVYAGRYVFDPTKEKQEREQKARKEEWERLEKGEEEDFGEEELDEKLDEELDDDFEEDGLEDEELDLSEFEGSWFGLPVRTGAEEDVVGYPADYGEKKDEERPEIKIERIEPQPEADVAPESVPAEGVEVGGEPTSETETGTEREPAAEVDVTDLTAGSEPGENDVEGGEVDEDEYDDEDYDEEEERSRKKRKKSKRQRRLEERRARREEIIDQIEREGLIRTIKERLRRDKGTKGKATRTGLIAIGTGAVVVAVATVLALSPIAGSGVLGGSPETRPVASESGEIFAAPEYSVENDTTFADASLKRSNNIHNIAPGVSGETPKEAAYNLAGAIENSWDLAVIYGVNLNVAGFEGVELGKMEEFSTGIEATGQHDLRKRVADTVRTMADSGKLQLVQAPKGVFYSQQYRFPDGGERQMEPTRRRLSEGEGVYLTGFWDCMDETAQQAVRNKYIRHFGDEKADTVSVLAASVGANNVMENTGDGGNGDGLNWAGTLGRGNGGGCCQFGMLQRAAGTNLIEASKA